ncbi:hypothetical protein OLX02_09785 [Novosphingobium sp. KCTC 2891]|uniref:hypothetical protein n=1 Tax=Novosphingobium sp. KCTC 2891 TaxID=2989730 RepID=UPI0022220C28|nr:hypothetical protein [Novosphingobium sp. KCTC 2891]MCW1383113.1 hypothetical protein [Novosphingobium sp. KCTC 2891]
MTDRKPISPAQNDAGENFDERDLAPEAHNAEQDDEGAQAQTIANEGIGRGSGSGEDGETERVGDDPDEIGGTTPDVVDHMKQMVTSGRIDMGAFRGERSDDDEEGTYGEQGIDDDTPRARY